MLSNFIYFSIFREILHNKRVHTRRDSFSVLFIANKVNWAKKKKKKKKKIKIVSRAAAGWVGGERMIR